jgi:hypothetical protein
LLDALSIWWNRLDRRTGVPASAESIGFRTARDRRFAASWAAATPSTQPAVAWIPVWLFARFWMYLPAQAGVARDG